MSKNLIRTGFLVSGVGGGAAGLGAAAAAAPAVAARASAARRGRADGSDAAMLAGLRPRGRGQRRCSIPVKVIGCRI